MPDPLEDVLLKVHHNTLPLSPFSADVLVRLLTLVSVAGIVLGCVVAIIYFQERSHEALLLREQGQQRVEREFEFLSGRIAAVKSDVLYLAEQETLQRFLQGDSPARSELERDYVRFATHRSVYDQIRFLDTTGREIVRVNFRLGQPSVVAPENLQEKTDRYYYRDALALPAGDVFISDFDLNVEYGEIERPLKPVLRCLTAVVDSQGESRGLLALNYAGDDLLRKLDRLSLPGATLLLTSDGHYIRGRNPEDAWGWLLDHSQSFASQFPLAWPQISAQPEGQFATAEGLFTFRHVSFSNVSQAAGIEDRAVSGSFDPLTLVAFLPADRQDVASARLLTQLLWIYAGSMVLLMTVGWYWVRSVAIRRQQARSIVASEARLRTLSDQLLTAQEQERRSISRQLHDELGQQVTAISLDLRSAERQQDGQRTQSLLKRAIEETDCLLKSIHEVATRVRPAVLDDLGLQEAVESMTAEIGHRSGLQLTTDLDFAGGDVPAKIGQNVYRILQEGVLNVVKHAKTDHATVTIQADTNQLRLTLEDDGCGFDPQQRDASRLGILGMQERTELLGGRFQLSSQPGSGTRIDVWVPFETSENLPATKGH